MAFNISPFLKISNSSQLTQFLHECVDDLIEKKEANFENYSNIHWEKEDYEKANRFVQKFYRRSVIEDKLEFDSSLPDIFKDALKDCYEIRKNEIFNALARECVLSNGYNLVENFDWKLKWVLGSSDLAIIKEPLLQVDLNCSRRNGDKTVKNRVNFEANLEQVDNLIKELSRIKNELE